MTERKPSISVPAEVEETIKAAAAEEGKPVSAWLAEAATEKAAPPPSRQQAAPLPANWQPTTKPSMAHCPKPGRPRPAAASESANGESDRDEQPQERDEQPPVAAAKPPVTVTMQLPDSP